VIENVSLLSGQTSHTYVSSGAYEVKLFNTALLTSLYPFGGHSSSFVSSFVLNNVDNLQQLYLGDSSIKELKN
jgi:hypothetical protein